MGALRNYLTSAAVGALLPVPALYCHNRIEKASLEQYRDEAIGKPVIDGNAKKRQERIVQFKDIQRKVENNWDNFDEQFATFDVVTFFENPYPYANVAETWHRRFLYPAVKLNINFLGMSPIIDAGGLVHEMAHAWHFRLKRRGNFEKQWQQIAGDGYANNPAMPFPECMTPMRNVAAVSCYGATNMHEDIATLVEEVYDLKTEPDFMTEEASRIEEKIKLAADYGFFSERERDNALGKIKKVYPVQLAENNQ